MSSKRGRPRIRSVGAASSRGKGVPLKSQAREMVVAAFDFFEREKKSMESEKGPLVPISKPLERAAEALNVSRTNVHRICKEKGIASCGEGSSKLVTPGKSRPRKAPVTDLDSFQEDAIRRHIYDYYHRKEYPTLAKLRLSLYEADLIDAFSLSSVSKILQKLGFAFSTLPGRKLLLERTDIVAWRARFLSQIVKYDIHEIIFLDKTWVNAGHVLSKGWTDKSSESMPRPTGKGGRLILCHAGSSHGFVDGAMLLFKSKSTKDYHEEMDFKRFYTWFKEQLLPNLDGNKIIVMDNAPYHSVQQNRTPTQATRKLDILDWLSKKNIVCDPKCTKGQLLDLVAQNKPPTPTYMIDQLAESQGHKVIRLPPYHCHFNPIELVWAQVKDFVRRNNQTFTISEVECLTLHGIQEVIPEKWRATMDHVKKLIDETIEREPLLDVVVDELIIRASNSDTDSESQNDSSEIDDPQPMEKDMDFVTSTPVRLQQEESQAIVCDVEASESFEVEEVRLSDVESLEGIEPL